ncbi:MAG TPA: helix-turn-helix domain-containing protein [Candidatus Aminicenantes bacterium]|nr:helix-turn-helix domain-containing protein [Candidatus Aminicenantes bacterium]
MNETMTVGQADNLNRGPWMRPVPQEAQPCVLDERTLNVPFWGDTGNERSLDAALEALVTSYLLANLNSKRTPLKEFLDEFEKRILRACLTLTQGHQRNAAAILGVKYTALFEKMRKHCINGRQMKLARRLQPQAE